VFRATLRGTQLSVSGLPLPPAGTEINRVDITVGIRSGGAYKL
jgi:hypothetical protein